MPGATDTRVIQMQFDNSNFEKNIKTSEKSLEKFKEELDFDECEKGLIDFQNVTKNLTFESIAGNLQKLTDKFTGLGTVSELVLSQIRRGIENVASKISGFIDSLGFEQVTAGLEKYKELNKSVQTIMAATGREESDVYSILERLNAYTDMTSYNFTDMAQNIGKFTSVGIKLEDAEKQMEGIANWAARSGAGINEASRAMYNLSQAMGVGKMTLIDWKSIENAGMATKEFKEQMLAAGVAAGTLIAETDKSGATVYKTAQQFGKQMEVNYQNLGTTLSKGWATSDVIQRTLMEYYNEDLSDQQDHSQKVIDLTKEQLDKTKKLFEDNAIGQKDWKMLESMGAATDEVKQAAIDAAVKQKNLVKEVTKDGKTIYKTAAKYGKQIEVTMENIEQSLKVGWLDKSVGKQIGLMENLAQASYEAAQKCTSLTDVLVAWKDQLSTGWMKSWQLVFGGLTTSMEIFSAICNKVGEAFSKMIGTLVGYDDEGEHITGILESWVNAGGRDNLWSTFIGEYDGLYEGAYGMLDVLHDIGDMISGAFWDIMSIFVGEDRRGIFKTDPKARNAWIGIQLNNITLAVKNFIKSIKDFFNEVPAGATQSRFQTLQDIFKGIFSTFVIGYTAIRDIVNFFVSVGRQLEPSLDAILSLFGAFGIGLKDTAKNAKDGGGLKLLFDDLLITIKPLTDAINGLITSVTEHLKTFFKNGQNSGTFKKFWQTIIDIINLAAKVITKVGGPILEFVTQIMDIISDLFQNGFSSDSLKRAGAALEKAVTGLFDGLFGLIPGIGDKIQSFIAYIFGFSEDNLADDADGESKTILGVLKKWLRKIFGGVADLIGSFRDEMGNISLFSIIKENLGLGLLGSFMNQLAGVLKGTNLYGIIMAFLGGYSLIKLIKMLHQGGGLFKQMRGFFQGARDALQDGLKLKFGDELESTGDKVYKIAKAIALIAASVAVLGSMNVDSLVTGVLALAAVMTVFAIFLNVMKKKVANGFKETLSMAGLIGALAAAILSLTIGVSIMILALKVFDTMSPEGFIRATTGLITVLGALFLFAYGLKQMKISSVKIGGIATLAIGIGLIVLSLQPLANTEWGGMAKMAAGLIFVLGAILGFTKLMAKMTMAGAGMGQIALLAIGIGIMVNSFIGLGKLEWGDLAKVGAGLVVFLGSILGFVALMKGMTLKGAGMGQLIIVALSIAILVNTLTPLAAYEWGDLAKIGAGLVVLVGVLKWFINNTESMKYTGMLNMVAVAGAIWILVQAVKPLAGYEWGDLAKMGAALVVLAGVLVAMTHLIKPIHIIEYAGMTILLAGLALTFASFALVMAALHGVGWDQIAAACLGFIAVLAVFGLVTKYLMKDTDILEATHTLIALAGLAVVMFVFSMAINEIKNVKIEVISGFSEGLAVLIMAFALAVKLLKDVPIVGALKVITILGVGIMALIAALSVVVPLIIKAIGNSVMEASSKLSLAAGMFADFTKIMDTVSMESIKAAKAKIAAFFDTLGVVKDSTNYVEGLHSFGECMSLLGFAVHQFQMSTEGLNEQSFDAAIKLITVGIIPLGPLLKNYTVGNVAQEFLKLGTAISLFYRSTQGIVYSDPNPAINMAKQILALKNSFAGFSVGNAPTEIFTLGVGLMLFNDAASGITTDEPVAFKLLQNLADQADNLDTLTKLPLETFKQQLSGLGGALSIYAEGVASATGLEIGEGTPDVSGALRVLHALTDELAKDSTKLVLPDIPDETELDGFGADLAALATALKKFTDVSKEMDWVSTAMALNTLDFMEKLQGKLTDDAVARFNVFKNTGVNVMSLATFGLDIAALGVSLKNYNDTVKNFKENQAALDVLDFMFKLQWKLAWIDLATANAFNNAGVHKTTLTDFGTDIAALGNAMWQYSVAVESFKDNQNVMKALDYFAGLKDKLNTDSLKAIEEFVAFGIKPETLTSFGTDIGVLGENLAGFANNVNFDSEKAGNFDNAIAALEKLRDISNRLPMVGGIVQIWEGQKQTLSNVATYIKEVGTAFAQMSTDLSGDAEHGIKSFNVDLVSSAFDMLNKLADIAVTFASRGWSGETNTVNDAVTYVGALQMMMENITKGFMNNPDQNLVKGIVTFMQQFREASAAVGGFGEKDISMFEALRNMIESLNLLMKTDTSYDFSKLGENMSNGIKDGIVGMSETMNEAMKQQIKDLRTAANNEVPLGYPLTFTDIGKNIAFGIRDGIAQGHDEVVQKVIDMVTAARDAAQKTADENSPSKVFKQIGAYISQGLALGIREDTKDPVNASKDMVKNIIDSTDGALSNLSWLLANGVDTNPTITPVLDLSNVQKGMSDLNGQFGNRKMGLDVSGVAARAGVSAWNLSAHPETIQNGTDLSGVYDRMTTLGNQIVEMGNQIQKMKVVLDTGVLVGGVTDGVDANIGRKTFYATRRN